MFIENLAKRYRYAIMVKQGQCSHETELCQVDSNPEAIAKAARAKRIKVSLTGGKKLSSIPQYAEVRVVDLKPTATIIH
jgi:hypothetical protein